MKEFWNKLITEYRKNQEIEKANYCNGEKWVYNMAKDRQRKIKEVFFKNFKKDIDECDYME